MPGPWVLKNLKLFFCDSKVGGEIHLSEVRGGVEGRGDNIKDRCALFKPFVLSSQSMLLNFDVLELVDTPGLLDILTCKKLKHDADQI